MVHILEFFEKNIFISREVYGNLETMKRTMCALNLYATLIKRRMSRNECKNGNSEKKNGNSDFL